MTTTSSENGPKFKILYGMLSDANTPIDVSCGSNSSFEMSLKNSSQLFLFSQNGIVSTFKF